ncbi:hypothetical protein K7I13_00180 [Brucepastera parasyntrophica]|uniref:hypothetical protein n=1 Tax=Brucepastera parasyntrophica TaxID=2880008 RepID=UPI00210ADEB5|nr:hypothetical protein [Brucepastera parasyntrophica]ULQ59818.1 hypothetical protein K7I13_00180 [Brucepastera parasyntrophica]
MFENVIAQPAIQLLIDDISSSRMPAAVLFSGPQAAGKLTSALETARILSCTQGSAGWTCSCGSCLRHRELTHPDLLIIGTRDCLPEIKAAAKTFLGTNTQSTRYLFIRSVRKLLVRFSPVLFNTEESRFSKAASIISDMEELLEELRPSRQIPDAAGLPEKTIDSLVNLSEKLETDCLYDSIPVTQVRNASSWAHLTPFGRKKILIVENADRMQESSRNAFLKLLEEPPKATVFILTSSRRSAIMPTILSRVRTYAFVDRDQNSVNEVISRVFHDGIAENISLSEYFNRFLPVSQEIISSAAFLVLNEMQSYSEKHNRTPLPALRNELNAVRTKMQSDSQTAVSGQTLSLMLHKCNPKIIWNLFLMKIMDMLHNALHSELSGAAETAVFNLWTSRIREAYDLVGIFNISSASVMDQLIQDMKDDL